MDLSALLLFLTAGWVSDYKGAQYLLDRLPKARELLADRDYDADWLRNALNDKGISACTPPRKSAGNPPIPTKPSTSNHTASTTWSAEQGLEARRHQIRTMCSYNPQNKDKDLRVFKD